jgi:hypothetical protein
MPTQTHVFDNRRNSYGRLNTAHMQSSPVTEILLREGLEGLPRVRTVKLLFKFALLSLLIR